MTLMLEICWQIITLIRLKGLFVLVPFIRLSRSRSHYVDHEAMKWGIVVKRVVISVDELMGEESGHKRRNVIVASYILVTVEIIAKKLSYNIYIHDLLFCMMTHLYDVMYMSSAAKCHTPCKKAV